MSKELLTTLESMGLIEYGSVIQGDLIRQIIGVSYPPIATKKEFDKLALLELGAVDYVRNILLGRGMYLSQVNGDYRILLPSENARQVELYISSADKKLSRALKLTRNTPKVDTQHIKDNTEARIIMKRVCAKRHNFNS